MPALFFLKFLYPSLIWHIPVKEKILFLTFDDGPVPEVTPWVLDLLKANGIPATFFCIGANVARHPDLFRRIVREGHAVGNHTQHHLNGWKTRAEEYLKDVADCATQLPSSTRMFRPPYGKITNRQIRQLRSRYRIVMWDAIAGDWRMQDTADQCFERVRRSARPGSILVFHDSLKAASRMKPALEKTIAHFLANGYRFELPESRL